MQAGLEAQGCSQFSLAGDEMNEVRQSLEERFISFVKGLENCENIDETLSESDLARGKRADFLLDNRNIVLEIKSLENDPEYKVEERLRPYRDRPEFPAFYWQSDLNEVLPYLPDGEAIRKEIFHAVTRVVQGVLEKADDQIEATKSALGITHACGVVAILNENVGMLAPELITAKASQVLLKTKAGTVRYRNIAYVWIISESHRIGGGSALEHLPVILLEGPTAGDFHAAGEYLGTCQRKWSDSQGRPFFNLGERADFEGLAFEKRMPEPQPAASGGMIPRHESWRRAYRRNPYLRSLSEGDFLEHTVRLLQTMTPHFLKDGRKLPDAAVAQLMEGWTHALEEAEFRRLDMRKLMKRFHGVGEEPDHTK